MLEAYVPILILAAISLLNAAGMIVASHVLNTSRPTPVKEAPYESGMIPIGDTRERFSVKFYLVAILFIIFDIETVFLIPWGVMFRELAWSGFVDVLIFIGILVEIRRAHVSTLVT